MDRHEQIEFILDHYENPRYKGLMLDADFVSEDRTPGCGDRVKIYLKVDPVSQHVRAMFEGEGCTISQASASYLMEEVNGRTVAEILSIDHNRLMDGLGREVVEQRARCATVALDILQASIQQREA